MIRVARPSDPERLRELKRKINDREYLAVAISRLAENLTRELVQDSEESP
jgi:hypothetical protein